MRDLVTVKAPGEWLWFDGVCPKTGEHSWIECDGWAFDASNGAEDRPIMVMSSDDYRRTIKAERIELREIVRNV